MARAGRSPRREGLPGARRASRSGDAKLRDRPATHVQHRSLPQPAGHDSRPCFAVITPTEHKTVQARILAYAQEIGWTYVPRGEAEKRRGFEHSKTTPAEQAADASPYFEDLLASQVRKLHPKY